MIGLGKYKQARGLSSSLAEGYVNVGILSFMNLSSLYLSLRIDESELFSAIYDMNVSPVHLSLALFTCRVNDIPFTLGCQIQLYADDTLLYCVADSVTSEKFKFLFK